MQTNPRGGFPHANTYTETWDNLRASVERVASAFIRRDLVRWALRMYRCSEALELQFRDGGLKLLWAHFCRVRSCPICQWRRSLMWKARLYTAMPAVQDAFPGTRWVFLTLTVRNCPVSELGQTLDRMARAWNRLLVRREFQPVMGWLRTVEITRGEDGSAHPHYHVLLLVRPSYFKVHYVSQKRWTELWQECMGLDYRPIVDVRAVRPGTDIVPEVAKYTVKPGGGAFADGDWIAAVARQLHKRRLIASGGILKQALRYARTVRELERLEAAEGEPEKPDLILKWRWPERRYKRRQSRGSASSSEG